MRDYRGIDLKALRVLIPDPLWASPVSREVASAVRDAAEALSRLGMQVIKSVKLPLLKVSIKFAAIMYREWLPGYRLVLGNGKPVRSIPELIANKRGKGQVSPATLAIPAMLGGMGPFIRLSGYGQFEHLEKLRAQILNQMGPGGPLLWPVFPTAAPRHGFAWHLDGSPTYTGIFNSLGFPSVVVPVGLSKEELPLAVQIIARPDEDETALAVAALLEGEFSGSRIPPNCRMTS